MNKKANYFEPLRPQDEIAARILTEAFIKMYSDEQDTQTIKSASDCRVIGNPKADRRTRVISGARNFT